MKLAALFVRDTCGQERLFFFAQPGGEHHELARIVLCENAKARTSRLAARAVRQFVEQRAQLIAGACQPVHVGHQNHPRIAHGWKSCAQHDRVRLASRTSARPPSGRLHQTAVDEPVCAD